jgi:predicted kinase
MNIGLRSKCMVYDEQTFNENISLITPAPKQKLPTLMMMVGIAGSGKSMKSIQLSMQYNAIIHSSDAIRHEILDDINSQDNNELVFKILHSRVFNDLHDGKNVIYDATNISLKSRTSFLRQLDSKKIYCTKVCVLMATPYEDCLVNNHNRERCIPDEVITRMYKSFNMPSKFEGFDSIQIFFNRERYTEFDFVDKLYELVTVPHDNPNHTLSIGEHCISCQEEMIKLVVNNSNISTTRKCCLFTSTLLHDIGKGFVKAFKNGKGEPTEIAHYFQHHCVGAYDSLFYLNNGFNQDEYIRTILLINYHMKPYDWENNQNPDKSIKKFKAIYGEELYSDIMLVHQCDLLAH